MRSVSYEKRLRLDPLKALLQPAFFYAIVVELRGGDGCTTFFGASEYIRLAGKSRAFGSLASAGDMASVEHCRFDGGNQQIGSFAELLWLCLVEFRTLTSHEVMDWAYLAWLRGYICMDSE